MTNWNRYREIDALRESGHPAEALVELKSLRKGASDAADRSSILLGEALCHRDLGRFDQAAQAATEAVRLLPDESPSRPYAEFSLSCIREREGKFDLAAQGFKALLKRHADLLKTHEYIQFRRDIQFRLIANLIVLGHAVEPLSIVNTLKTEEISPEEKAELSYREAEANRLLGRHDQALGLYREAISGSLERRLDTLAHFHAGEILYDRGEFSRALGEFRIAETLADVGSPDRDIFAEWVKHTLRATENTGPEETVS